MGAVALSDLVLVRGAIVATVKADAGSNSSNLRVT